MVEARDSILVNVVGLCIKLELIESRVGNKVIGHMQMRLKGGDSQKSIVGWKM